MYAFLISGFTLGHFCCCIVYLHTEVIDLVAIQSLPVKRHCLQDVHSYCMLYCSMGLGGGGVEVGEVEDIIKEVNGQ